MYFEQPFNDPVDLHVLWNAREIDASLQYMSIEPLRLPEERGWCNSNTLHHA